MRYLQALLGHAQLSTTELYTRVAIAQLSTERNAQLSSLAAEAAERA